VYFNPTANPTSKTPATKSIIQTIFFSTSFSMLIRPRGFKNAKVLYSATFFLKIFSTTLKLLMIIKHNNFIYIYHIFEKDKGGHSKTLGLFILSNSNICKG
jgi:hypothetical protein